MTSATEKQKASLTKALTGWKDYDQDRPWLSHGIVTVLLDRNGEWHAQFDMTKWQANLAQKGRKTWSKAEALEFEKCLASAFRVLSSQLGQFRKRLN